MKILLHVCCGPCLMGLLDFFKGHEVVLYFYNPNIEPREEYEKRLEGVREVAVSLGLELIEESYDNGIWHSICDEYKDEPEGGERCRVCFWLRLEHTAVTAKSEGFDGFGTTLSVNMWKDVNYIDAQGKEMASERGLKFFDFGLDEEGIKKICFGGKNWLKNIICIGKSIAGVFMDFKIKSKEGKARVGEIVTKNGVIKTPNFIPVATQATVKAVSSEVLEKIGVDAVLCNTYHLYLRPGEELISKFGGLHKFMGWSRPLFTDSGGFQVFSLAEISKIDDDKVVFRSHLDKSKHSLTPEKSIEIQEKLGADIIFTLDECIPFESSYEDAKKSMERTHAWAERCLAAHKSDQALFGIIQGGKFEDLRRLSAKFIGSLDFPGSEKSKISGTSKPQNGFDGYGLGSIFGKPKEETLEVIKWVMEELPEEKPKHMLGIGAVEDIFNGVALGGDTFDCVLPTRLARAGYIFTSEGNLSNKWRYRITNAQYKEDKGPLDRNCGCDVCKNYSRAYLRHLFKTKELLAYSLATEHNLWFFNNLMKEIRLAISNGKFKEMKEKWLN